MSSFTTRALTLLALLAALALPAIAGAKPGSGNGGDRPKKEKAVSWNLKGQVTAKGENTVTVLVKHSNRHGRALRERSITFDLSKARIVVRDVNGDGKRDLGDVNVGDGAKVQARLAKSRLLAEGEAVPAKRAIFKAPRAEEPAENGQEAPGSADGS